MSWTTPPPSPLLKDVLAYWESCRAAGRMPRRADIDPLHIPNLLPRIMLIDVLREPLDFRYRVIGTGAVNRLSADYTGSRFSELPSHRAPSPVFSFAATIVEAGRPGWAEIPYLGPDQFAHAAAILGTPLSEDGVSVSMLLYGIDFYVWRPESLLPTKRIHQAL